MNSFIFWANSFCAKSYR